MGALRTVRRSHHHPMILRMLNLTKDLLVSLEFTRSRESFRDTTICSNDALAELAGVRVAVIERPFTLRAGKVSFQGMNCTMISYTEVDW